MATRRKLLFFSSIVVIFFLISNCTNSSELDEKFKEKKVSYLEFILSNLENKILINSKKLVYAQLIAVRIQYQNIGSRVQFYNEENKIIIDIEAVMNQRRYKEKRYKPKLSDCNIVRNIIFFNQHGYGFFQKRNRFLTTENMEEYFINNFLNNMRLDKKETEVLVNNININVEIISPIKGHNIYCSGNLIQDELE